MSLTFNFRLQQTVYAWAYGQPLKLLRPSPALLEVLHSLALDFSIASLERVEAWLQNEHAQRVAKQLPSRDAKSDAKLLLFLSAYIAEVLGRAIDAVPMWQKINNVPMVSWLGPEHTQRPMLALTSAIHNCLSGETPDLLPQLLQALDIQLVPASQRDKPLPLVELPADTGFKAGVELSPEQASQLFPAEPARMSSSDLLSNFFPQAPGLFAQAQCVRAALVQANTSLYVPRYVGGSAAEVVFDLSGRLSFEDLISISNHLFELKKKDSSLLPAPARLIAEHLKDNGFGARMLDWDAPAKLLGWPLRMSSIWVEQKHLPDGMLSYDGLQLLVAPKEVSLYAMLLPRWYWSAEYLKRWQDASMARHGQLHDIDAMVRLAEERASTEYSTAVAATEALPAASAVPDGPDIAASATDLSQHSDTIELQQAAEPEAEIALIETPVTPAEAFAAASEQAGLSATNEEPETTTGELAETLTLVTDVSSTSDAPYIESTQDNASQQSIETADAHSEQAPVKAETEIVSLAAPVIAARSPTVQLYQIHQVQQPPPPAPAEPAPAKPAATPGPAPAVHTPVPAAQPQVPPSLQTLNTPTRSPSWLSRYWLWLLALAALAVMAVILR